ncbi:hypothetical protein GFY24_22250 [Nocardia sp. SYP-A9097]|uniref:hypothetical protein n=1 Tax=Nocardia sp. SYP-A9097 TaxID=2663237 RepID=UPI00129AED1C|nr:hypothetical protein [Nocardia sp. SYP-A9097]MRH90129.1 hypothetical protein [Nocardia sp. SYP-A9097]
MAMVPPVTSQLMQPWVAYPHNQSNDVINSPVFVWVNGPTVHVVVHLEATNLPSKPFNIYYKLDGKPPVAAGAAFATDGKGSGTAHFAVGGLAAGNHDITVEFNDSADAGTLYMNASANNPGAGPGIPFTI